MTESSLFYIMSLILLINSTNFVFVIPILPDFLLKRGIPFSFIGLILSFYQIGHIITAFYLGKNLIYLSKINVMIIGQVILVLSNIFMCFLSLLDSISWILILSMFLRFWQGVSYPCVVSTIYSYVPVLFPNEMEKKYAFLEITTGLGLSLGPVIGGILYGNFGFNNTFIFISGIYLFAGLLFFPIIKNGLKEKETVSTLEQKKEQIGFSLLIKNKPFILTFLMFILNYMCYSVIQPGFSDHVHSYQGSDETVGILFGLGDLTYALTGVFFMNYSKKFSDKKKGLFLLGGLLSIISLLIMGPEEFTFLPKNLWSVALGILLLGSAQMFYFPFIIPEFMNILHESYPNVTGIEEMSSGMFSAGISITILFGSILGGVLTDFYGFRRGITLYAFGLFFYLFIFWKFRDSKTRKGLSENERELKLINLNMDN